MKFSRIWRNFLTLSAGETVARILHALAFFAVARRAGAEAFGAFGVAMAIALYMSITVQQGFDTIGIRSGAKEPEKMKQLAAKILGLRLISFAIAAIALIIYTLAREATSSFKIALLLLSFGAMVRQVPPRWALQALETPMPIALSNIGAQFSLLIGSLFMSRPEDIIWAGVGQLAGETISLIYLFWQLSPQLGWPTLSFDGMPLLRESLPLTMTVLIGTLLYNFDILALDWLRRPWVEIGLYAAAYRCVNIFSLLVGNLQISILPLFSRAYPDTSEARRLAIRAIRYSVPAGTLLALIFTLFGRQILVMLYGEAYSDAAKLLSILTWVMPLQALRGVLRQMLLAFHNQHLDLRNMSAGLVVNVTLDLLLIPQFGPMGCAISTIASECVLTALSAISVRKNFAV